ncbi:MAG: hypothetical protein ACRDL5_06010 [Solirubrobacteraceae bacterium]
MLIAGALLSVVCGLANSAAALLEKREMLHAGTGRRGLALLVLLARRPWWLVAMGFSVIAWASETAALGLAPVPVVTTLRSAGRGGLVIAGHQWLDEHFGRLELVALVLLTAGGILTAVSAATHPVAAPLSIADELLIAAISVALTVILARGRHSLGLGSAVGVLFVATGIYGKEIGDRIVRDGSSALTALLVTPGPWLMIVLGLWAISLLQHALTRANAASVAAVTTTISSNGLIAAGALLYHQPVASGTTVIPLVLGLIVSALGAAALATQHTRGSRKE